jgi:hypothetical protein
MRRNTVLHPAGWPVPPLLAARAYQGRNIQYGQKYHSTLNEIFEPTEVMGPGYPSETFRVLKTNELREHGEYRTQRLVLEA